MFDLSPTCPKCGAVIRDVNLHQTFHDSLGMLVQQAFGLSDEEYQRLAGDSPADRDARLAATAKAKAREAES